MRLFGAVVMIAAMVWLMLGCGTAVSPVEGDVVLQDAASGAHYELSVAEGALTLTGIGSAGTAVQDTALTDSVTGTSYQVSVKGGALTLAPGGAAGTEQIGLTDTATAARYELAMSDGELTLNPSAGAAQ